MLHHSSEVRRAAVAAARATISANPTLMGPLLAGLRHWANNTHEALVLVVGNHCALGGHRVQEGSLQWGRAVLILHGLGPHMATGVDDEKV